MTQDLLPRTFQADIERFYVRVIGPALCEFRPLPPSDIEGDVTFLSLDDFLDHAEKQTSHRLACETRRCYALSLAAIFERQLRIWARTYAPATEQTALLVIEFDRLVRKLAEKYSIDLAARSAGEAITELYILANAVRHGDGRSIDRLRQLAPSLWARTTEAPILSESIEVTDGHFERYVRALIWFWGIADREPGAIIDLYFVR